MRQIIALFALSVALGCAFELTTKESALLPGCDLQGSAQAECLACRHGDGAACRRLSVALERGVTPAVEHSQSLLTLARGCELGDVLACVEAQSRTWHLQRFVQRRQELGQRVKQACDAARCDGGPVEQCLLRIRCDQDIRGPLAAGDGERLAQMCEGGDAESCRLLAVADGDAAYLSTALRTGCTAGDPAACLDLATTRMLGLGEAEDLSALDTFHRTCEETGGFTACRGAEGYLWLDWLVVARLVQGMPALELENPTKAGLLEMEWGLGGDSTTVIGFCIDRTGRVRDPRVLQRRGTPELVQVLLRTVSMWQFGPLPNIEHPCWMTQFDVVDGVAMDF